MSLLRRIIDYFDLTVKPDHVRIQTQPPKKFMAFQYLAVTLGVIIQPFLENFIKTNQWSVTPNQLGARVIFGFIIGIAIFPAVYKNSWDEKSPIPIQMCSIFVAGLGWQTLFNVGVQSATN